MGAVLLHKSIQGSSFPSSVSLIFLRVLSSCAWSKLGHFHVYIPNRNQEKRVSAVTSKEHLPQLIILSFLKCFDSLGFSDTVLSWVSSYSLPTLSHSFLLALVLLFDLKMLDFSKAMSCAVFYSFYLHASLVNSMQSYDFIYHLDRKNFWIYTFSLDLSLER